MKSTGDSKRKGSHSKRPGSRSKTSKNKPSALTTIKSANKLSMYNGSSKSSKMSSREQNSNFTVSNKSPIKATLTPGLPPSGKGILLISKIKDDDDKISLQRYSQPRFQEQQSPPKMNSLKNGQSVEFSLMNQISRQQALQTPNMLTSDKLTPQQAYNGLEQKSFGRINLTFDNTKNDNASLSIQNSKNNINNQSAQKVQERSPGNSQHRSISEQLIERKIQIEVDNKNSVAHDQGKQFEIKMASVTLSNECEQPDQEIDLIEKRYQDFEVRLREASGNEKAFEIQYFIYKKLMNRTTNQFKFRHTFFKKLPTNQLQIKQVIKNVQQTPGLNQSLQGMQSPIKKNQIHFQSAKRAHEKDSVIPSKSLQGDSVKEITTNHSDQRLAEILGSSEKMQIQPQTGQIEEEKSSAKGVTFEKKDFQLNANMNLTFQNMRTSTGMGATMSNGNGFVTQSILNQSAVVSALNQMCYTNHKMVENIPGFLRSLCSKVKDENNKSVFDYYELDQIVEAATEEKIPLVTAKKWAISDKKKGQVMIGKNQDDQCEIASMTKICTAYTICRILEELDLHGIENAKNIYIRVTRKAAFMPGTSAYVQTDMRLSLYDCFCGLLLPSGNDIAITLATAFGRWLFMIGDKQKDSKVPIIGQKGKINVQSNTKWAMDHMISLAFRYPNKGHEDYIETFVNEMNRQSQKLRLKHCQFINPHGLQQKANHASASDVICLMSYAMKYDLIAEVTQKARHQCDVYTFDLQPRKFQWINTNRLLNEYFIGSKTGITPSAGPCLVTQFKYGPYESQGVLIDSKTLEIRWKEMSTILLWQFNQFLKKNKIGGYNPQMYQEFMKMKQQQQQIIELADQQAAAATNSIEEENVEQKQNNQFGEPGEISSQQTIFDDLQEPSSPTKQI